MTQPAALVKSTVAEVARMTADRIHHLTALLQPYGMNAKRFRIVLLDCLQRNQSLIKCTPISIVRSAYYAAQIGLELGGPLGDAYLVPYFDKRSKATQAQCIPGYRGLIHVAHDAEPDIDHFDAEIVYEADDWEERKGTAPSLLHIPKRSRQRGARIAVYAVVHRKTSSAPPQFAVLDPQDVERIRDKSTSRLEDWQRRDAPWIQHEDEMWKKTAVRRLVKMMNLRSTRARLALDLDAEEGRGKTEKATRAEDLKAKLGGEVDAEVVNEPEGEDGERDV